MLLIFFFNDTATTEIYTLSLHDALPIYECGPEREHVDNRKGHVRGADLDGQEVVAEARLRSGGQHHEDQDRKSTRLNSSHLVISYAVFCLKKKSSSHPLRRSRSSRRTRG